MWYCKLDFLSIRDMKVLYKVDWIIEIDNSDLVFYLRLWENVCILVVLREWIILKLIRSIKVYVIR